jgi:hypothetical protein
MLPLILLYPCLNVVWKEKLVENKSVNIWPWTWPHCFHSLQIGNRHLDLISYSKESMSVHLRYRGLWVGGSNSSNSNSWPNWVVHAQEDGVTEGRPYLLRLVIRHVRAKFWLWVICVYRKPGACSDTLLPSQRAGASHSAEFFLQRWRCNSRSSDWIQKPYVPFPSWLYFFAFVSESWLGENKFVRIVAKIF